MPIDKTELFDVEGRKVKLDDYIKIGGEAIVYPIPASALIAKIYLEPISALKQEKICKMVQCCDPVLTEVAAWPLGTIHQGKNGPVQGFVMPRILGEPIHKLYDPEDRVKYFPHVDWSNLVQAALNVAYAFDGIHKNGIVIGDVNENNIFVGQNGSVKILDCDSFQISFNGKQHICEVGSPDFTPPELQGTLSFRDIPRTTNHDNFGLAIIIFRLLFFGLHPFDGVYVGKDDMHLEKAIFEYRYAHGRGAGKKKMSPPMNTVGLSIVPGAIAEMFNSAFTEKGATDETRPEPLDWIAELSCFCNALKTCDLEPKHKYFIYLTSCPLCRHERETGRILFESARETTKQHDVFKLDDVWQIITSIPHPGPTPAIDTTCISIVPRPLPPELQRAREILHVLQLVSVTIATIGIATHSWEIYRWILAIAVTLFTLQEDSSEKNKRVEALRLAVMQKSKIEKKFENDDSEARFLKQLDKLKITKMECENLNKYLEQKKNKLRAKSLYLDRARETKIYFRKFIIDACNFHNSDPEQMELLNSYRHQIKTAFEVTEEKIDRAINKGLKPEFARELFEWKNNLVEKSKINPSVERDLNTIAELDYRYNESKMKLEKALLAGISQLREILSNARFWRYQRHVEILTVTEAVEQAQADLRAMD